jgi:hypothetical protein
MSTAKGMVEIKVTADIAGQDPQLPPRFINARLLTPEIEAICRRQGVETSDINSMKWPIFGLSRHATCKLLMLRSDFFRLLFENPDDWRSDFLRNGDLGLRSFAIWFFCGSAAESGYTRFDRMYVGNIQPLAVTNNGLVQSVPRVDENGDPVIDPVTNEQIVDKFNEGDAMYVVTFHDSRWRLAGARVPSSFPNDLPKLKEVSPLSWRDDLELKTTADLKSPKDIVERIVTDLLADNVSNYRGGLFITQDQQSSRYDTYTDETTAGSNSLPEWLTPVEWETGFPGIDSYSSRPVTEFADYLLTKCGLAIAVFPKQYPAEDGYNFVVKEHGLIYEERSRTATYLIDNDYQDDVIAGSRHGTTNDFENPDTSSTWLARILNIPVYDRFFEDESAFGVVVRKPNQPDGRPPDVFKVDYSQRNPGTLYATSDYLPNPFSQHIPFVGETHLIGTGQRLQSSIFADEVMPARLFENRQELKSRSVSKVYDPIPIPPVGNFGNPNSQEDIGNWYQELVERRRNAEVCDIWLRGWAKPPGFDAWFGASWIEYRLQTDQDGFGYPTTRIWGDYDDPLFIPIADRGPLEISTSGLAKSWRDCRGKNHIHVDWPFGIPCLIKITGVVGPFNAGIKAWQYKAQIVLRDATNSLYPPNGPFLGQLVNFSLIDASWAEKELVAYNLAELANKTNFAAPGYRLPLAQSGFDILPIGQDRLGNTNEVIVQGMLYLDAKVGNADDTANPDSTAVVYFCLSNAVDGDCPSPLTDTTYDAGVY